MSEIVKSDTQSDTQSGQQSGQQDKKIEIYKKQVLDYCVEEKTAKQISNLLNIKSRQYISSNIIKPLINDGKLDYTNKNAVNAKNQRYITVKKE